ncbi:MAG: OmpA family protein [Cyclobacteriaceae bacterium]|nr:PD40 domain-containing protein [Cyclobacteriaceae bacterium]MCH8515108.1 OmpA family protein [Cyclobacteriaceae bacterium]
MNVKRLYLLLLLAFGFILISTSLQAQSYKKLVRTGDRFFYDGYYAPSLPFYLEAYELDDRDAELNYKIGIAYLKSDYKYKAGDFLKRAINYDSKVADDIYFHLGRAAQLNHDMDEAIQMFRKHQDLARPGSELSIAASRHIRECEVGKEMMSTPENAVITNIGPVINTSFSEYGPVISADESVLVFTSRRDDSTGGVVAEDNMPYEDIYFSYKRNDKWSEPVNAREPLNSDYHDAAVALSPDGTLLFLYYDIKGGDLYYSRREGNSWSKPESLGENINSRYREASVSISADNKTIYFSSDIPGGYGGMDIYRSDWDEANQQWGEAINLGPTINTSEDEESPFIHPDGTTLYFSSRGHKTMGGFDIFRSDIENGQFTAPFNLGYPINTADDDIYFTLSQDNQRGYYASVRADGFGAKDIYVISMPERKNIKKASSVITKIQPKLPDSPPRLAKIDAIKAVNPITIFSGMVADALTAEAVNAKMVLIDNETGELVSESYTGEDGEFLVVMPSGKNYGLTLENEDYLFHSENFNIPASSNYQQISKRIEMMVLKVGSKVVLNNIFFDTNEATLRPESGPELERLRNLLEEVPRIKIEISGHTDNVGAAQYNLQLSERRAQAVKEYLVVNGIAEERLIAKGYGMEKPIADNRTVEGRQENRRTEFEIIEN